ncbi:hypothetical protein VR44_38650, partial [Streptomyces katrae]
SGTNAHVIIEQPPVEPPAPAEERPAPRPVPWLISGGGPEALREQAARLLDHIERHPALEPADVARSLATSRAALEHRAAVLGTLREDFLPALRALAANDPATAGDSAITGTAGSRPGTAFLFSGQGSQRLGMGRELYESFPVFADAFDAVCAHVD